MQRNRRSVDLDEAQRDSLRAEQLFLVLDIIKQASRSYDPATFFRLLVDTIYREVKSFSHVSIFEWDPDRRRIKSMAMAGEGGGDIAFSAGSTIAAGGLAEAIRTGACYLSNNLLTEARGARPVAPLSRSALCIPIKAGTRLLALLNIESRETKVFGPADVALFEILCEHLANFLHGINLYEEVRGKSVKIQRITEICRRMFEAQSLQEALNVAVRAVVDEYGFYGACVAFVSEDGRHLLHQAHHADVEIPIPPGYRQEIGRGIVGLVASQRRTVCCNDTAADPDYVALLPDAHAELCIPLLAGETLVGILDVNAREPNAFDSEDVSLMETLAGQLALVVEKARYLEQTRRTRDYLENLIANAGDGILALDPQGLIIRWNLGMERLMGYKAEEILGSSFRELPAPENLQHAEEIFSRVMKGEILEGVEDRGRCKDGRIIDVVLTLSPIKGPDNMLDGVSVIVRDITERKRMEENVRIMHRQMQEAEEKFLELVEKAPDAIFFLDAADATVLLANARAEAQTHIRPEDLVGRHLLALHPAEQKEETWRQFERTVRTGAGPSIELRLARGSGQPLDVEVTSSVLSYGGRNVVQWFCRDISDRRRAEKEKEILQFQLLQTEKLSAIGQLVSGVAHELNNPLTGVIGYSQLMVGQPCDDRVKRGLEKIYAEARRCHRIVQNLLTFAREHTPEKSYISINDIIESMIELRSYQLRVDNTTVAMDLSKEIPRTMGDFHQLQQVFMNIINNAQQAIKEGGRSGLLSIRSSVIGETIRVEIADNGLGIPPEHLKKIFDPFFTTKQTGQGTGLGLSICYGIVEEHDGKIYARSTPGEGSVLTIDLPVLRKESVLEADALGCPDDAVHPQTWKGRSGCRLLVVDDESSILDVLSEALTALGHEVDTAINGRLALKKIMSGPYDAVITDLKMPGMNGQDLFEEVSRANPALAERFLFATGDVIARETREFLDRSGQPWVEKPFDVRKIVSLLAGVLPNSV